MQTSTKSPIETTITEIKQAWSLLFGSMPTPTDNQLAAWILQYGSDAVKQSVTRAARKYERLNRQMSAEDMYKYLAAVCQQESEKLSERRNDNR